MKAIELLNSIKNSGVYYKWLDDEVMKAISELEELEDTLRTLKKVNVKLNIQINNRELKPISDECMIDNG